MIKSFQVNHKDLREPVNSKVFLNIHFALAARAFKPSLNHAFRLNKLVQALLKFNGSEETHGFARDLNTQVHKVIEGTVLEATAQTLSAVD